jgi:nicotinate-nucleotide pyrophosphorylase (carboxylating)
MDLNFMEIEKIVRFALAEDIGTGDITTSLTIPSDSTSRARIVAREAGVISGIPVASLVFSLVAQSNSAAGNALLGRLRPERQLSAEPLFGNGETISISMKHMGSGAEVRKSKPAARPIMGTGELTYVPSVSDGAVIARGDTIVQISGPTSVLLTAERTALNIMQRMSGIATKTARLVNLIEHTGAKIVDTRKTVPGLRILDKYAVRCGGGSNHRFGLYDAVLIKDNHVQAAGSTRAAVLRAKAGAPHTIKIEVEADTIDQVREALDAGADMILFDNMSLDQLREGVKICKDRALTEASGCVTEETVVGIAETGVDLISVGALTHSVKALDLSLEFLD